MTLNDHLEYMHHMCLDYPLKFMMVTKKIVPVSVLITYAKVDDFNPVS